jgi:hypothetical protein
LFIYAPMGSGLVKGVKGSALLVGGVWLASRSGWVCRPLPGSRWSALVEEGP